MKHHQALAALEDHIADAANAFVGSFRFLGYFLLLTPVWCTAGIALHFDPYPWQAYTFSVSVLAIIIGSLILIASNRSGVVDRAQAGDTHELVKDIHTTVSTQELQTGMLRNLQSGQRTEAEILAKQQTSLDELLKILNRPGAQE